MKMWIEMSLQCEKCNRLRQRSVPARFHYSDGCYTVLAIEEQKCVCETPKPKTYCGNNENAYCMMPGRCMTHPETDQAD